MIIEIYEELFKPLSDDDASVRRKGSIAIAKRAAKAVKNAHEFGVLHKYPELMDDLLDEIIMLTSGDNPVVEYARFVEALRHDRRSTTYAEIADKVLAIDD